MASFTIPSLTIPAGNRVFGPFAVAGGWSSLDLTLDIANLADPMDVVLEYSVDGGAIWRHLLSETGLRRTIDALTGLPITTEHFSCKWSENDGSGGRRPASGPPAQVRLTLSNPTAWLSFGGSLVLA
jgi:hypothetical protein